MYFLKNLYSIIYMSGCSVNNTLNMQGGGIKKKNGHKDNCECPICAKKRYISRRNRSRRHRSRRNFRGGYVYDDKSMKEYDVTMELSTSKSMSKSRSKSKARGTRRRRH